MVVKVKFANGRETWLDPSNEETIKSFEERYNSKIVMLDGKERVLKAKEGAKVDKFPKVQYKGDNRAYWYVVGEEGDKYILVFEEKLDHWKNHNPIERHEYYEDIELKSEMEPYQDSGDSVAVRKAKYGDLFSSAEETRKEKKLAKIAKVKPSKKADQIAKGFKITYDEKDKERGTIHTPFFRSSYNNKVEPIDVTFYKLYQGMYSFGYGFLIKAENTEKAIQLAIERLKIVYNRGAYNLYADTFIVTGFRLSRENIKVPYTPSFMENTHHQNQFTPDTFKTKKGDYLKFDRDGDGYGFWYAVNKEGKRISERLKGSIFSSLFFDNAIALKEKKSMPMPTNKAKQGKRVTPTESLNYRDEESGITYSIKESATEPGKWLIFSSSKEWTNRDEGIDVPSKEDAILVAKELAGLTPEFKDGGNVGKLWESGHGVNVYSFIKGDEVYVNGNYKPVGMVSSIGTKNIMVRRHSDNKIVPMLPTELWIGKNIPHETMKQGGSVGNEKENVVGEFYYDTRKGKAFRVISIDGTNMGIQYYGNDKKPLGNIETIHSNEFNYYVKGGAWNKWQQPYFKNGGSTPQKLMNEQLYRITDNEPTHQNLTKSELIELANTISYYDRMDQDIPEITTLADAIKLLEQNFDAKVVKVASTGTKTEGMETYFLAKDNSGRGEQPNLIPESLVRGAWDLQQISDDNEMTLLEFLENSEPGDLFEFDRESLENVGPMVVAKKKLGGAVESKALFTDENEGAMIHNAILFLKATTDFQKTNPDYFVVELRFLAGEYNVDWFGTETKGGSGWHKAYKSAINHFNNTIAYIQREWEIVHVKRDVIYDKHEHSGEVHYGLDFEQITKYKAKLGTKVPKRYTDLENEKPLVLSEDYDLFGNVEGKKANKTHKKQSKAEPGLTNLLPQVDLVRLGVNALTEHKNFKTITSSLDSAKIFYDIFPEEKISIQEYVYCLYVNRSHKPIAYYELSKGGIAGSVVDLKLIAAVGLKVLAAGVIIAHNHPSGNLKPSGADLSFSKQFAKGFEMVDIKLLDCLILIPGQKNEAIPQYTSFQDEGLF